MTQEVSMVAATITGKSKEEPTREALVKALEGCLIQFTRGMKRIPTKEECMILWAAVQRYFGIPEEHIEPPSQRQWN